MAANEVIVPVPAYLPDPHGHAMFYALARRTNRELNRLGRVPVDVTTFDGWAQGPQRFIGLAGALAGRQRVTTPTTSEVSKEKSASAGLATGDPALTLLYARMKAQRS